MPLSFEMDPTRYIAASDGREWTVAVRRGWVWPGWRWLDWLDDHVGEGATGSPVPFLALLAVPAVAARRAAYVLRRRTDWRVTVYPCKQSDYRPKRALLDVVVPSRAEANTRAEELATAVAQGNLAALR